MADPAATAGAIGRSLQMLAVVDPEHYRPASAAGLALADLAGVPRRVVEASAGLVVVGLAPVLAVRDPRRREIAAVWLAIGGVTAVTIVSMLTRAQEGAGGYGRGALAIAAVFVTVFLAGGSASAVLRRGPICWPGSIGRSGWRRSR
jgi:hypothetical protein